MSSKHYKWQTRWRLAGDLAVHECGLQVSRVGGVLNAADVAAALAPKHGGHNVPLMLRRLEREARELLAAQAPPLHASALGRAAQWGAS
jgi:hypothetical protein